MNIEILNIGLFLIVIVLLGIAVYQYWHDEKKWARAFFIFGSLLTLFGVLEQSGIIKFDLTSPPTVVPEEPTVPVVPEDTTVPFDTVKSKPYEKEQKDTIGKKDEPVKKERVEATGVSGYKLNEKWALEEAEEIAKKKLLNRLNKSNITYDIIKETVDFVEGEGWKATVVISTYK